MCLLFAIRYSPFAIRCSAPADATEKHSDEACRSRHDLELLFPRDRGDRARLVQREGLDVTLELIFPVDKSYAALRDGTVDFVGGSAHSALSAFPQWQGAKLLCAQAQGMYWFLVMHRDLGGKRGDIGVVKGRSIGAAPWVDIGLAPAPIEAGIDPARDKVKIAPVPGAQGAGVNFGVTAAKALEDRKIDGFWANGMGAEVAVRRGVGTVVLDVRRGDGPSPASTTPWPRSRPPTA